MTTTSATTTTTSTSSTCEHCLAATAATAADTSSSLSSSTSTSTTAVRKNSIPAADCPHAHLHLVHHHPHMHNAHPHRPNVEHATNDTAQFDLDAQSKTVSDAKSHQLDVVLPSPHVSSRAYVQSMEQYQQMYTRSIEQPDAFWRDMALENLDWFSPFTQVRHGHFKNGDVAWFLNGKLNACYNCVDRHLKTRADKVALLWEGDEPDSIRRVTYAELFAEVCRLANALSKLGVRKGDNVLIFMPMVPEAVMVMLACARLGAAHSVVFAGFSAEAVRERIEDGGCTVVVTSDEGRRGGRSIALKKVVDQAIGLLDCPEQVQKVLVFQHTGSAMNMQAGRDVWWHDIVPQQRAYAKCEVMDAEDTLFMLFTSGSTGKPKGIVHSHGGYLLHAMLTTKYVFDVHDDDVYACMADVGWITGHSYIVYGPLLNGATTFLFESTPLYPDPSRYWQMVQRHRITQFYTAPTAIRALMKFGDAPVKKYDRSSLRVLGSVGEPINPEAWRWYHDVVGDGDKSIVDTYWQTETGGHMITPLPGATPAKPGSASLPFFGIKPAVLTPEGQLQTGNDVSGVLCISEPWPGMARTIFNDHPRFVTTYLSTYPGYYFTGDGCIRDRDGYYWITGRVDDVINVSGHRIGSAEIESALITHPRVAESAVIGVPHDVKGQALFCYVIPKEGVDIARDALAMSAELANTVREQIGAFAKPDEILITHSLPKTRSGKIMRRLLRKIACMETDSLGDISTLADESVVPRLIDEVTKMRNAALGRK